MTTFGQQEITLDEGMRVDLFEFRYNDLIARKCNQDFPIVLNSVVYDASTIAMSSMKASQERIQNELRITVPRDDLVVRPYLTGLPGKPTTVVVSQAHWDGYNTVSDKRAYWSGDCLSVSFDGGEATMTFQNTMSAMNKVGLRQKYQTNCPHFVYRGGCKLAIESYLTQKSAEAESEFDLYIPTIVAGDRAKYLGGVAIWNGQYRMIREVNEGTKWITLLQPFDGFIPPDNVGLAWGCDRSAATCHSKFGNLINFGGFPFIPHTNHFVTGVK